MATERNRAFDRAKGAGALLVVLIHATPLIHSNLAPFQLAGWTIRELCQIAVPYFFILSGWMLGRKWSEGRREWTELSRSTSRLLRLYVPWFLLFLLLDFATGRQTIPWEILRRLLGFSVRMADVTGYHLWFLPSLILAQILCWSLAKATRSTIPGLVAGGILFVALYGLEMTDGSLPWRLDLTEGLDLSFPCVALGMYLASLRELPKFLLETNPAFLIAPLVAEAAIQLLLLPESGPVHVFQAFRIALPAILVLQLSREPSSLGTGRIGWTLDLLATHSTAIYLGHMLFLVLVPFEQLVHNGFLRDNILRWSVAVAGSIGISTLLKRSPSEFVRRLAG